MKRLLILSFDLIREGESATSLAIASILAFLKKDPRYKKTFEVEHLPINCFQLHPTTTAQDLLPFFAPIDGKHFDLVAISAYIWNEYLINDLMQLFRQHLNFKGDFVLGGYQISYSNHPELEYPEARYFISGYAEASLLKLLTERVETTRLDTVVDFTKIPSPYLTGELVIQPFQKMVRMETKRGCPYQCSFCAHRDLTYNKVYKHHWDKISQEIAFFKANKVQKINIIDPIFNAGNQYLEVLNEFIQTRTSTLISVQARFETIYGDKGALFLEYCEQLNSHLEFGLQTAIELESQLINRKNNPDKIKRVMQQLNERSIGYEISLIYGLPHQTLDSFQRSIDFVIENGCTTVTAFPLMLLKGTELYNQKEQFGFQEQPVGDFNIPVVTQSNSFSENDWLQMQAIAASLVPNSRI